MASRRLLEKLGEAALRSSWVNGKWQKAAISAKKAARLRREDLVAGKEWAYEIPHKEVPVKQPKGHKRHRLEEERANKVQENLAKMDQKIEEYREARKVKDIPFLDRITLTPKMIRAKLKIKV